MPEDEFYAEVSRGGQKGTPGSDYEQDQEDESSIDWMRIVKFLLNVLIKAGLLGLLHLVGWLKLAPLMDDWGLWGTVATAGLLAVALTLLAELLFAALGLTFVLTCGLAIVLVPFVGYFMLRLLLELSPNLVRTTHDGFWPVLLIGSALVLIAVPTKRRKRVVVTHQGHKVIDSDPL